MTSNGQVYASGRKIDRFVGIAYRSFPRWDPGIDDGDPRVAEVLGVTGGERRIMDSADRGDLRVSGAREAPRARAGRDPPRPAPPSCPAAPGTDLCRLRSSESVSQDRPDLRLHRATVSRGPNAQSFLQPFVQTPDAHRRHDIPPASAINARKRPLAQGFARGPVAGRADRALPSPISGGFEPQHRGGAARIGSPRHTRGSRGTKSWRGTVFEWPTAHAR